MKNIDRYRQGKFNLCYQEWQPDGSVKMRLVDRKAGKVYKLRVKNLDRPGEEVIDYATGKTIDE